MPVSNTTPSLVVLMTILVSAGGSGHPEQARSGIPRKPDDATIVHVLNRLGFGPAPGDIERVRATGLGAYIDAQLHPERLADAGMGPRLAALQTTRKSTRELMDEYFAPALRLRREQQRASPDPPMRAGEPPMEPARSPEQMEAMRAGRSVLLELAQQKVLRAAYSERQLEEVMVDFWFNHFNVFAGKGQTRVYLTEYERDVIRPHVFGRFRDLLGATAESPAMLFYLDNWQSAAAADESTTARRQMARRGLPAQAQNRMRRGLNENYARELLELHTLGVDGGYTQRDVQEIARAFTGWTIMNPRQGGGFRFEPRLHDAGGKTVLGQRVKAGGGRQDGDQVLDILASHPSTARHIATKLARRFIADTPPRAVVDRAAARFRATKGDIRDVVRSIITSPEFFSAQAYRAKVKTPFEFVVSAVRATGALADNAQPLVQAMRELGMPIYGCQPPTGYADKAEAWVNTGALLDRINFAVALTGGRLRGVRWNADGSGGSTAGVKATLIDAALAGELSEPTAATVARATTGAQAAALILGSPEFQKR